MADVVGDGDVGLRRRADDRRAVRAGSIATLPLIEEGHGLASRPGAGQARQGLRGLRRADDRRWRRGGRHAAGIARDRDRARIGAVEAVSVGAMREAGHRRAVAPLPERPTEAVPVRAGNERRGVRRPVRDPESVPGSGDARRVAERGLPEVRRRVDDGAHSGTRGDLVEPRIGPRLHRGLREAVLGLEVERGRQLPGLRLRDREEEVRLNDRVCDARRIGRACRSREVIAADAETEPLRSGAVDRIRRIDERAALRRLCVDEAVGRRGDLGPADRAVEMRDVDPLGVGRRAGGSTGRRGDHEHGKQSPDEGPHLPRLDDGMCALGKAVRTSRLAPWRGRTDRSMPR